MMQHRDPQSFPQSTLTVDEDIYDICTQSENATVRRYATKLRELGATVFSLLRPGVVQELIRGGIPELAANDIHEAFRAQYSRGSVGVFWDLENIGLPSGVEPLRALAALRDGIVNKFGDIKEFKAYIDLGNFAERYTAPTRVLFRDCGVEVVDAPHNNRKEVADKHIIVDALWFAMQSTDPNRIVCLITGDSDFSPLLSKLRMSGIKTLLISGYAPLRSLRQQVTSFLRWPESFIPGSTSVVPAEQRNRTVHDSAPPPPPPPPPYALTSHVVSRSPARGVSPSSRAGQLRMEPSSLTPAASPSSVDATVNAARVESRSPQAVISPSANDSRRPAEPTGENNLQPTGVDNNLDRPTAVQDLLDCIAEAQTSTGVVKVRRSYVGILFQRLNPLIPFKTVVAQALAEGKVAIGGQLAFAWIARADDVKENPHDNTPQNSSNGWWICLRYASHFPSAVSLQEFEPESDGLNSNLQVLRQDEGSVWHRMAIGPFESIANADAYYQLHFGDKELLPKITQNYKQYVNPK